MLPNVSLWKFCKTGVTPITNTQLICINTNQQGRGTEEREKGKTILRRLRTLVVTYSGTQEPMQQMLLLLDQSYIAAKQV